MSPQTFLSLAAAGDEPGKQNHDGWKRNILFRDYLRTHPEDSKQYEALKRALAKQFESDREGYTDAKTEFIETVLAKATLGE